ncbi:MAG TPA: sugar phosphate isomerase/epimerase family protein, partial [Chitinophagaceae bacterium]|nr:sugar phosphate isomerase/epimerase family protein [Chitinophagaceae bacterium]
QCVEVMCWPKGQAERRYAGVTHIDVDKLDDEEIDHIHTLLQKHNVYVSGLGYYPNPLDPEVEKREFYLDHIKKVIRAAAKLGVPVVNTFVGRHPAKNMKENIELFAHYWPPVISYAESQQVKIAIENCPMLFTYDEWPGGKNMAINPVVWEQMFSLIGSDYFGLNYDPSHMIWQQMDYLKPLNDFSDKLFHIHLKDAKLYRDKLDRVGILATPLEYHSPKLPGLGDVDWRAFLAGVKESGYTGPVVIEFEDKDYEHSYEDIVKGMLLARDHINRCM